MEERGRTWMNRVQANRETIQFRERRLIAQKQIQTKLRWILRLVVLCPSVQLGRPVQLVCASVHSSKKITRTHPLISFHLFSARSIKMGNRIPVGARSL